MVERSDRERMKPRSVVIGGGEGNFWVGPSGGARERCSGFAFPGGSASDELQLGIEGFCFDSSERRSEMDDASIQRSLV